MFSLELCLTVAGLGSCSYWSKTWRLLCLLLSPCLSPSCGELSFCCPPCRWAFLCSMGNVLSDGLSWNLKVFFVGAQVFRSSSVMNNHVKAATAPSRMCSRQAQGCSCWWEEMVCQYNQSSFSSIPLFYLVQFPCFSEIGLEWPLSTFSAALLRRGMMLGSAFLEWRCPDGLSLVSVGLLHLESQCQETVGCC